MHTNDYLCFRTVADFMGVFSLIDLPTRCKLFIVRVRSFTEEANKLKGLKPKYSLAFSLMCCLLAYYVKTERLKAKSEHCVGGSILVLKRYHFTDT